MTIWKLCVTLKALYMKHYNNTQPNLKRRSTDISLCLHKCRSIRRKRGTLRFWRRLLFLNRDLFAVHFWKVEISRPMTPKMQNSCIVGWYDCAVVQAGSFDRYWAGPISIILCWICLHRLVSNAFAWNHHSTDVGQAKKSRNTTAGLNPATSLLEDVSAECGSRPYIHQRELTALERRHTNNKGHNNNDIYARHGNLTLNWFIYIYKNK